MSHWVLFSAFVLAVLLLTCWVVCVIRPELERILDRMFPEYRPKTLKEYLYAVKLVRKRRKTRLFYSVSTDESNERFYMTGRWTWPSPWRRISGAEKDDLEARIQAARLE
ncbi:uncharacterized protein P174DRAFT_432812 [Aspergillus novofumigatus IBT 16806]|uniref:Uncharacterized protein n=1 Tax=Aspergillus novofumigatus (strain IBT 16806) TaxID=1392255 RepID=A0A2I1C154_ASPN1|nr:uncharacterized protein P174DRAFT_432812 [Aspergillus novofumigatus IBT 16806]PKX91349.1 hypothetical protein P174DRAFT_432812 [Aspergillus novofumigatus IBT 16806]